ncbi:MULTISPECIES: hypothetical protein [unclassified Streptomyces]|uniref:hypothetical protein n=1 Tax=unclassified Streptomyces TaxID=2593676 RepID=UPI002E1060AF|nr:MULTISPECIES: hypothetical protein [unclassified Streptomyces]WSQ87275.1 hypothetical protein OG722_24270 [Streptomyces sp. NBC_01212]WSR06709.1 hypothetical protein OG265_12155 [Streptomyces sp. NBC_01208]
MSQVLYGERSWNPLAQTVELTEERLRRGGRTTPLDELNLGAMAEAYLRGHWLGGGGAERPLDRLAEGSGIVPLTRVTGTTTPLKTREAAAFARAFGELAVRRCGGPGQVAALADRARVEGVPLWIARRLAGGPAGPVAVAVDRRLVRVDVWGPYAPAVRVRAPRGFQGDAPDPSKGLRLTVGEATADLVLRKKLRRSRSAVEVRLPGTHWVLRRESATSSWLLRDGRRVALLARPPRRPARTPDNVLRPLSPVHYETDDPLDAVMAQAFAVTFGIGDTTGTARFRSERHTDGGGGEPVAGDVSWDRPWFSNLGNSREDNESGGGDGWGADGGDGGDSGGGGGDGGGGDGGGGGGD